MIRPIHEWKFQMEPIEWNALWLPDIGWNDWLCVALQPTSARICGPAWAAATKPAMAKRPFVSRCGGSAQTGIRLIRVRGHESED